MSWAHEHAPDPRMLLDLDLFASAPGQDPNNSTSMIDQIRTLQAMGYLNATVPPPPPQPANVQELPPLPPDTEDDIRE